MDRQKHLTAHPPVDASAGHEVSDAHFRPIVIFMLVLCLLVVFVFALMVWMFNYLERRAEATDQQPSALADRRALPPEPRLQVVPRVELDQYRESVTKQIESYEWIDKDAGVVRIPIERAIELLSERGLPTAAETPPATKPGNGGE